MATSAACTAAVPDEQATADYITSNITGRNTILTDNSQTYAVMLLTGKPDLFVDRVDKSDGPWKDIARDPGQHVGYMLMSTDGDEGSDLLTQLYPDAAAGSDPSLPVIYRTDRYVLVGVPANFDPDDIGGQQQASTNGNGQ